MIRPIASSVEGFPGNHEGVRDLLFLNEGNRKFREVGIAAGLDKPPYDHSLGASFPTSTATDGPTSTSRTTRIRTASI